MQSLKMGHLFIYPTETWYAIGCPIANSASIEKILKIKKRPLSKPLPLIAFDLEQVTRFCDLSTVPHKLLDLFWPGPLTLIIPVKHILHPSLCDALGRVAIRVSSSATARVLASACDCPIVSSSANISGQPPVCNIGNLSKEFLKNAFFHDPSTLVLTEEEAAPHYEKPSTIIEVIGKRADNSLKILREGAVSAEMLREQNFIII